MNSCPNILTNLIWLLKLRRWTQAHLAQKIGLSRQAVSKWFVSGQQNSLKLSLHSLLKICQVLNLKLGDLAQPIPKMADLDWKERFKVSFLWDRLYSNSDDFLLALYFFEPKAVARYIQVCGLYPSANLLGNRVWTQFNQYKKYVHPTRRNECEKIWQIHQQLSLK